MSAPSNLQPICGSAKPKRPSVRTTPSTQNVFVPSNQSENGGGTSDPARDAAHAYDQRQQQLEIERQRQHLEMLEMRQQQQLRVLGAGGSAYDRLQAAGMPMPNGMP